jgi:hypothetical protein
MRGRSPKAGKGVGRKKGAGSTTIRVPNGCLQAVKDLIESYRLGEYEVLKSATEIREHEVLKSATEIREHEVLKSATEIREHEVLKSVTEIREPITPSHLSKLPLGSKKASRSDLDRLPRSVQRQLIKRYGTLSGAINAGVYILGHKAFVPY